MLSIGDFETAVRVAREWMAATVSEENDGTLLLAAWASQHLCWTDVDVPNETSFEEVWRDPDTAFGKRMGHVVTLIQSGPADVEGHRVTAGLVEAGDETLSFFAVGDASALLVADAARFCGVVTGTYEYRGSNGTPQRAVTVVGMFDCPENRARPRG